MATEKPCSKCGDIYPIKDFYKRGDGRASQCKRCISQWNRDNYDKKKKYREDNKDKFAIVNKKSRLKTAYGISLEDYNNMLLDQDGVCKICNKPQNRKINGKTTALSVDHCHYTGRVRGLLCDNCNNILGRSEDSVDILSSAIRYLIEHQSAIAKDIAKDLKEYGFDPKLIRVSLE